MKYTITALLLLPTLALAFGIGETREPNRGELIGISAAERYIDCVRGFHSVADKLQRGGFSTSIDETPNRNDAVQAAYDICADVAARITTLRG